MTEEQAREKATQAGWADKVAVQKTSFKANSKALAEKESEGIAKMIYRCEHIAAHVLKKHIQDLSVYPSIVHAC